MNPATRSKWGWSWILIPVLGLGCTGCAQDRYAVESSFGSAVRSGTAVETIAAQGTPPQGPQGLDGASAKAVVDRYQASSRTPPAPINIYSVGMGAAGSSPMTVPAAVGTNP